MFADNCGLILVRELDERRSFGGLIERQLAEGLDKNSQFADLLRQLVCGRLAGYGELNDAAQLARDPTFRSIGSKKIWRCGAALSLRSQSFQTTLLTQAGKLVGLATLYPGRAPPAAAQR